jgi:hypothetical protein
MNITMMLETVQVDVEYEVTKCDNSNGVGGGATYEVDIHDVEVGGVNIMPLLLVKICLCVLMNKLLNMLKRFWKRIKL